MSFDWWKDLHKACMGGSFTQPPSTETTNTDAFDSLHAQLQNLVVQGKWTRQEFGLHINLIKLRAFSTHNQRSANQGHAGQQGNHVLHKQPRRSKFLIIVNSGSKALELKHNH